MQRVNVHIVHNPNGGWDLKKENSNEVLAHHQIKETAIDYGRAFCLGALSKKRPSELFIHKEDGQIEERNTYGDDPYPPRG